MAGDILCASYDLYLVDGNHARRSDCDFRNAQVEGRWTRALNETSTASVTVNEGVPDGCCGCALNSTDDMLVIDRAVDGVGESGRVWDGPTSRAATGSRSFTVEAFDRSAQWERHERNKTRFVTSGDQSDVWADVRRQQGPVNVRYRKQSTGVASPPVDLLQGGFYSSVLNNLDAVRWSVVGDTVHGPRPIGSSVVGRLNVARDFADPDSVEVVSEGFIDQFVVWFDTVDGGADCVVWPETKSAKWPRHLTIIGPVGDLAKREALALAKRQWRIWGGSRSPVLVTGQTTLTRDATVCVDDLVPGNLFAVDTDQGCGGQVEIMELVNVVVNFARTIEGGRAVIRETRVAVDLAAPGADVTSPDLVSL